MTTTPKPIDDGGPAFPAAAYWTFPGMSLRQHYAGLAMDGLVAHCSPEYAAGRAVKYADALIAELNKGRTDATDEA